MLEAADQAPGSAEEFLKLALFEQWKSEDVARRKLI